MGTSQKKKKRNSKYQNYLLNPSPLFCKRKALKRKGKECHSQPVSQSSWRRTLKALFLVTANYVVDLLFSILVPTNALFSFASKIPSIASLTINNKTNTHPFLSLSLSLLPWIHFQFDLTTTNSNPPPSSLTYFPDLLSIITSHNDFSSCR